MTEQLQGNKFSITDIFQCLKLGLVMFKANTAVSVAYSSVFALIGLVLLGAIGWIGASPLAIPVAGGFMLIGPILLSGFFRIADSHINNEPTSAADAFLALTRAPSQLWIIALICTMLFLVWITDAATLYAFMVGDENLPYTLPSLIHFSKGVIAFEFWASVMGSVIAFIILSVSAFSVPLLYQNRCNLVSAITNSVKTIFINFRASLIWGIMLSFLMILSILIMPLFVITLPVLAFASYELYKKVFPAG